MAIVESAATFYLAAMILFSANRPATVLRHVQEKLLADSKESLADSALNVSVHHHARTQSKYINLYFPNRDDNPDPTRQPYTVRLSDHRSSKLFRPNAPDAEILIGPKLSEEQQRKLDYFQERYARLSHQLLVFPSQRRELMRERTWVRQELEQLCEQHIVYSYQIVSRQKTLEQISQEMNELLRAYAPINQYEETAR